MPKHPPSAPLRAQLRERFINRIAELNLNDFETAEPIPPSPRLRGEGWGEGAADAAANIGITVRMTATRPYGHG